MIPLVKFSSSEELTSQKSRLGEGVFFHEPTGTVCWVDILKNRVFLHSLSSSRTRIVRQFTFPSRVLHRDEKSVVIIHKFGISALALRDENVEDILCLSSMDGLRCNDANIDPNGFFWVGVVPTKYSAKSGYVFSYKPGRTPVYQYSASIPNTFEWDQTRDRFYFADSAKNEIYYSPIGAPRERKIHFAGENSDGVPDGSTLDSQGNLWNCRWGGSSIYVISPEGKIAFRLSLPMKYPTSCTWAQPERKLLVTSGRLKFPGKQHDGRTMMFTI